MKADRSYFRLEGATTTEKLRGTKVWVPTPGRLHPTPGLWTLSHTQHPAGAAAVRVRGYYLQKIFKNSDAKYCILVTTCCEISCFLKTTAKKLGDQCIVGPPIFKLGDQSPRSLWLLRLWLGFNPSGPPTVTTHYAVDKNTKYSLIHRHPRTVK